MSEERQQLLEQKRKRLQELKQRRNGQSASVVEMPRPKTAVDASTQTTTENSNSLNLDSYAAPVVTSSKDQPLTDNRQLTRFDVAIQATTDDTGHTRAGNTEMTATRSISTKKEISSFDLNEALIESVKLVNRIQINKSINLSETKIESKTNSAFIKRTLSFTLDRQIIDLDVSPHKEGQFVVCYTKSTTDNYDAIVFDQVSDKLLPVNYLSCISVITKIRFDVNNTGRIIGSSSNGALCIWEIEFAALIQSPSLSTPPSFLTTKREWQPHLDELVLLQQVKVDTNECILTLSKDGVLNIWSSNLLNKPKYSVKLSDEASGVRIKDAVYLGNDMFVGEINKRLLKMVLVSLDGKIYNQELNLIHEDKHSLVINSVESIGKDMIISAHSDWQLRLWKEGQTAPFKILSMFYVAKHIVKRPHADYQFITVGLFKQKYYVDLWDISKKLYSPLLRIVEETDPPNFTLLDQRELQLGGF
ncbi:hypothetical protein CANMA_003544 [Candida margitis]|uniref:uncharacterized protein n=1 Tax=Candida margitis TaxID=1775924 RepID=UPI002225D550|nr:uncharacterized protein CANMA_003544 [Candida margitis]KAI5963947.1 hypothetical protein CANMA_003544 [Candida margitis]